ncbi:MAG: LptF/LptG family permease [Bacteroidales bacterium]
MKKIDLFILKSFLGPFVVTFIIVTFALLLQFLWLYIDELVGKGLGLLVIAEFLGWGTATLIPLVLPLATLFASIMTLGDFGENNELLAMKAAGISLPRILSPLIVLSFIISIGAFFAANNLIPVAYNNIYALRYDIKKTKEEIKIPTGVFYDGIENYILRINKRNDKTGRIYDIMVYNHKEQRGNNSLTLADSGSIKLTKDKKDLIFTLYDGYSFDEPAREPGDTNYALQRIGFKKQEMIISLADYAFQRSDQSQFSKEVMSQNLTQLGHTKDSLDSAYTHIREHQLRNLFVSGGFGFPKQLDSSYIKYHSTALNLDTISRFNSPEEEKGAIRSAIAQMGNAITILDNYQIDEQQYAHPLRKVRVERFRKFTLSIACFIFFFIGAPLGAIIRKGGLGTPVVVSMFFFIIYWVIDISGKKLAVDGVITPAFGTLISSLVLFPIGVYLTWKSTRDSSLFNAEVYITFFKNLLKRVKREP